MFGSNLEIALAVVQERRKDQLKQSETKRLLKGARAGRASLRDRVLLHTGVSLISFGMRLTRRYQNVDPQAFVPLLQMRRMTG